MPQGRDTGKRKGVRREEARIRGDEVARKIKVSALDIRIRMEHKKEEKKEKKKGRGEEKRTKKTSSNMSKKEKNKD